MVGPLHSYLLKNLKSKKMKVLKLMLAVVVMVVSLSTYAQKNQNIKVASSQIEWEGKKVLGSHNGTLNFKSGSVSTKNGKLVGGTFAVDMTSITVKDLEPGKGKEKLEGHLKSDDFFGVDNHTQSTLVFKSVKESGANKYQVKADLTIKGKTHPVEFEATFNGKEGSAKVTVDRTKYDIKYGSGSFFDDLGDKAIDNDFTLDITVKI